jgi:Ubiquitin carboxyl-terminal hydrolase/Ulp1 protease family, C-terminal catalytic domain
MNKRREEMHQRQSSESQGPSLQRIMADFEAGWGLLPTVQNFGSYRAQREKRKTRDEIGLGSGSPEPAPACLADLEFLGTRTNLSNRTSEEKRWAELGRKELGEADKIPGPGPPLYLVGPKKDSLIVGAPPEESQSTGTSKTDDIRFPTYPKPMESPDSDEPYEGKPFDPNVNDVLFETTSAFDSMSLSIMACLVVVEGENPGENPGSSSVGSSLKTPSTSTLASKDKEGYGGSEAELLAAYGFATVADILSINPESSDEGYPQLADFQEAFANYHLKMELAYERTRTKESDPKSVTGQTYFHQQLLTYDACRYAAQMSGWKDSNWQRFGTRSAPLFSPTGISESQLLGTKYAGLHYIGFDGKAGFPLGVARQLKKNMVSFGDEMQRDWNVAQKGLALEAISQGDNYFRCLLGYLRLYYQTIRWGFRGFRERTEEEVVDFNANSTGGGASETVHIIEHNIFHAPKHVDRLALVLPYVRQTFYHFYVFNLHMELLSENLIQANNRKQSRASMKFDLIRFKNSHQDNYDSILPCLPPRRCTTHEIAFCDRSSEEDLQQYYFQYFLNECFASSVYSYQFWTRDLTSNDPGPDYFALMDGSLGKEEFSSEKQLRLPKKYASDRLIFDLFGCIASPSTQRSLPKLIQSEVSMLALNFSEGERVFSPASTKRPPLKESDLKLSQGVPEGIDELGYLDMGALKEFPPFWLNLEPFSYAAVQQERKIDENERNSILPKIGFVSKVDSFSAFNYFGDVQPGDGGTTPPKGGPSSYKILTAKLLHAYLGHFALPRVFCLNFGKGELRNVRMAYLGPAITLSRNELRENFTPESTEEAASNLYFGSASIKPDYKEENTKAGVGSLAVYVPTSVVIQTELGHYLTLCLLPNEFGSDSKYPWEIEEEENASLMDVESDPVSDSKFAGKADPDFDYLNPLSKTHRWVVFDGANDTSSGWDRLPDKFKPSQYVVENYAEAISGIPWDPNVPLDRSRPMNRNHATANVIQKYYRGAEKPTEELFAPFAGIASSRASDEAVRVADLEGSWYLVLNPKHRNYSLKSIYYSKLAISAEFLLKKARESRVSLSLVAALSEKKTIAPTFPSYPPTTLPFFPSISTASVPTRTTTTTTTTTTTNVTTTTTVAQIPKSSHNEYLEIFGKDDTIRRWLEGSYLVRGPVLHADFLRDPGSPPKGIANASSNTLGLGGDECFMIAVFQSLANLFSFKVLQPREEQSSREWMSVEYELLRSYSDLYLCTRLSGFVNCLRTAWDRCQLKVFQFRTILNVVKAEQYYSTDFKTGQHDAAEFYQGLLSKTNDASKRLFPGKDYMRIENTFGVRMSLVFTPASVKAMSKSKTLKKETIARYERNPVISFYQANQMEWCCTLVPDALPPRTLLNFTRLVQFCLNKRPHHGADELLGMSDLKADHRLRNLPNVLVFSIGQWELVPGRPDQKRDFKVFLKEEDLVLDVGPFVDRTATKESMARIDCNYQLQSVVCHQGKTATSGHYVCFARRTEQTWYLCDDSTTDKRVNLVEAFGETASKESIRVPSSYAALYSPVIFFYERIAAINVAIDPDGYDKEKSSQPEFPDLQSPQSGKRKERPASTMIDLSLAEPVEEEEEKEREPKRAKLISSSASSGSDESDDCYRFLDMSERAQDILKSNTAWYNDEIINAYLCSIKNRSRRFGSEKLSEALSKRGEGQFASTKKIPELPLPSVAWASSYFYYQVMYPQVDPDGYFEKTGKSPTEEKLAKEKNRIDFFGVDIFLLPVHLNDSHWALVTLDNRKGTLLYYDSFNENSMRDSNYQNSPPGRKLTRHVETFFQQEYKLRLKQNKRFILTVPSEKVPNQAKTSGDCGPFLCIFANCVSQDLSFAESGYDFGDAIYMRKEIAKTFKTKKLLPNDKKYRNNRFLTTLKSTRVEVKASGLTGDKSGLAGDKEGRGLFATADFEEDEYVTWYDGELMSAPSFSLDEKTSHLRALGMGKSTGMVVDGKELTSKKKIDATKRGLGAILNFSDERNAVFKSDDRKNAEVPYYKSPEGLSTSSIIYVKTLKPVKKGEQFFVIYSSAQNEKIREEIEKLAPAKEEKEEEEREEEEKEKALQQKLREKERHRIADLKERAPQTLKDIDGFPENTKKNMYAFFSNIVDNMSSGDSPLYTSVNRYNIYKLHMGKNSSKVGIKELLDTYVEIKPSVDKYGNSRGYGLFVKKRTNENAKHYVEENGVFKLKSKKTVATYGGIIKKQKNVSKKETVRYKGYGMILVSSEEEDAMIYLDSLELRKAWEKNRKNKPLDRLDQVSFRFY